MACSNCTIYLVERARARSRLFGPVRRGMVLGMRAMAWWHGIDPRRQPVHEPQCQACVRFIKTALKERSPTFRWLNRHINPRFDAWVARLLSADELAAAKERARAAFDPPPPPPEA